MPLDTAAHRVGVPDGAWTLGPPETFIEGALPRDGLENPCGHALSLLFQAVTAIPSA
jgi:hypothetical protein